MPFLCAAAFILPALTSCGEDDGDEWNQGGGNNYEEQPSLSPGNSISCPAGGGSYQLQIKNYKPGVSVSSTASWCRVSYDSQYARISVDANNTSSARNCYVELKLNGNTASSLYVSQAAASGTGGNTGGNTGGGNTPAKPAAPTGVRAYFSGSAALPEVTVECNTVSGATSYTVYRSTSAQGSYTQIGSNSYPKIYDRNVSIGKTYYYKVKAGNSAGMSDYSSPTSLTISDSRKPGPVTYTNRSVSGTSITLRWTIPTHSTYGKPDKIVFRLYDPKYGWIDAQELSGTATSVSFNYIPWVDSDGYVKCGVIPYNSNGSGGGQAQVYDTKNKRWLN